MTGKKKKKKVLVVLFLASSLLIIPTYLTWPDKKTSMHYRTTCLDSHSLSVLGWYTPGLSELLPGNRLLVLDLSSGSLYCPFMGERGTVVGVSGWWRVEGGLQGARSPFWGLGVARASRHEGSMNGLCLASWCGSGCTMYEYIRVVMICKIIFKRCLFLRRN